MLALADLTGRMLAHGVWCVSDPDQFVPLIAHEKAGKRAMFRVTGENLESAIDIGKDWLEKNPDGVDRGLLVFDAYLTLADGKKYDALFVRAMEYGATPLTVDIALRYVPGGTDAGFRVGSPKVLKSDGLASGDWEAFFARFWAAAKGHPDAAVVWAKHLDDDL